MTNKPGTFSLTTLERGLLVDVLSAIDNDPRDDGYEDLERLGREAAAGGDVTATKHMLGLLEDEFRRQESDEENAAVEAIWAKNEQALGETK